MVGKVVNKRELAEIMGVSQRTVSEWQGKGMPVALFADKRGLENQYDTAAVVEWRLQNLLAGERRESSKERLEKLQGDRLELELWRDCENLVQEIGAHELMQHAVLAARSVLLNAGVCLRQALEAKYGIAVDADLINRHIDDALRRLSEYQAPDPEDDASADPLLVDGEEEGL